MQVHDGNLEIRSDSEQATPPLETVKFLILEAVTQKVSPVETQ